MCKVKPQDECFMEIMDLEVRPKGVSNFHKTHVHGLQIRHLLLDFYFVSCDICWVSQEKEKWLLQHYKNEKLTFVFVKLNNHITLCKHISRYTTKFWLGFMPQMASFLQSIVLRHSRVIGDSILIQYVKCKPLLRMLKQIFNNYLVKQF